jgi:hypothetical protein
MYTYFQLFDKKESGEEAEDTKGLNETKKVVEG